MPVWSLQNKMYFNSKIFVLAFLPVFLAVWFLSGRADKRLRLFLLIASSLVFYGWANPVFVPLILLSGICNFLFGKWLRREKGLYAAVISVGANVLALFACKYLGFFEETLNAVLRTGFTFPRLIVPAGISFFTFQQIAYLVDCRRGGAEEYDVFDYLAFVTFFPTVLSGPITYHSELIPQLWRRPRFDWENFTPGAYAFSVGIFKKVILADTFGAAASAGFAASGELNAAGAVITALSYTLQIYFDFSGYSDMALGTARMMGIELPQNFDSPYSACDISAFWKRWHMSLTRFLTKYIYIPLGGSRRGSLRTCLNTMIVFGISGLWHGNGWTFVVWGLLHGLAQVVERIWGAKRDTLPKALRWGMTMLFVNFAWVFFRSPDMTSALIKPRSKA